ncbi:Tetratricopeptide repeat-like domain-containing protein [Candidatus Magnetomoraceae bacterium gMMP-15]
MAKKKKISRKQLLKEPDEFLTLSRRLFNFVMTNQKYVIVFIAIIMLIAFIGVTMKHFFIKSENEASILLEQVRSGYEASQSNEKASQDRIYKNAAMGFEKILDKYPRTNAGKLSLITYANISYNEGYYDRAIELYKKALKYYKNDLSVMPLIIQGLGYSYSERKDYKTALEYFNQILLLADGLMKGEILFQMAHIYERIGDNKKSLETYQKITSDYPDSMYYKIASDKLSKQNKTKS